MIHYIVNNCMLSQEKGLTGGVGNGAVVNTPLLEDNKMWRSLETVEPQPRNRILAARSSIRSWIYGLFNNRNSDVSLRKGGYNDLQLEKENFVCNTVSTFLLYLYTPFENP